MSDASEIMTVPARRGRAQRLTKGQAIKIINTQGTQVCDTWAFNAEDLREFMSMEHMRPTIGTIFPRQGHNLITNRRRPILLFEADTSPGIHDTLMAACDDYRYGLLGCTDLSRQLHRQSHRRHAPDRPHPARDAEPAQSLDEHPRRSRRQDRLGRAGLQARRLRRSCAPRWTASSRCRPARRTSCPSTAPTGRSRISSTRCWRRRGLALCNFWLLEREGQSRITCGMREPVLHIVFGAYGAKTLRKDVKVMSAARRGRQLR